MNEGLPAAPPLPDPTLVQTGRHCCRLSEQLEAIRALANAETVPLGEVVKALGTRGHTVLAVLLALPFLQPVPLVGLSTPVGAAIAILGVLMALGLPPWLPQAWLRRPISARQVVRVVQFGQALIRKLERFIRPRGEWFHRHPWAHGIAGIILAVSGTQLALPLPIVFTNTLPALVIVTTAVGMLEEDAILSAVGALLFLAAAVVFSAIVLLPLIGLRILL